MTPRVLKFFSCTSAALSFSAILPLFLLVSGCSKLTYDEQMRPYVARYAETIEAVVLHDARPYLGQLHRSGPAPEGADVFGDTPGMETVSVLAKEAEEIRTRLRQTHAGVQAIAPSWWPDQQHFSRKFTEALDQMIRWNALDVARVEKLRTVARTQLAARRADATWQQALPAGFSGAPPDVARVMLDRRANDEAQAALSAVGDDYNHWLLATKDSWANAIIAAKDANTAFAGIVKRRYGMKLAAWN